MNTAFTSYYPCQSFTYEVVFFTVCFCFAFITLTRVHLFCTICSIQPSRCKICFFLFVLFRLCIFLVFFLLFGFLSDGVCPSDNKRFAYLVFNCKNAKQRCVFET